MIFNAYTGVNSAAEAELSISIRGIHKNCPQEITTFHFIYRTGATFTVCSHTARGLLQRNTDHTHVPVYI